MQTFLKTLIVASTLATLAGAGPALAHDIVLMPTDGGGAMVRYGHPGDWQPIERSKLVDFKVYGGGSPPQDHLADLNKQDLNLMLAAGSLPAGQPVLLTARYDNGLWSRAKVPAGEKAKAVNTTRVLMPDAATVTNNLKFAKAINLSPDDQTVYKQRVGHLLELVPMRNPATVKAGETLPVQVLFRGKPLAGAGIEVSNGIDAIPEDQIKRVETDAEGIANLVLNERGTNTLAVDVEKPNDGSLGGASRKVGADKFVLIATYTFVK